MYNQKIYRTDPKAITLSLLILVGLLILKLLDEKNAVATMPLPYGIHRRVCVINVRYNRF
jgi:hypothetical protein